MWGKISVLSGYRPYLKGIVLGLLLLVAYAVWAKAEPELLAMDGQKIVTGSSVWFRAAPSLEADIIGRVDLGAVVSATRRTKEKLQTGDLNNYWYLIAAGDKTGWISGDFLRDFKLEEKEKIWFRMIRERMDNPDLSFADRVVLYRFIDVLVSKTASVDSEQTDSTLLDSDNRSSAFELGRLLALQKAFDLVNWENAKEEPYLSWVKEHEGAKRIFHDEVSGQWLVPATDYWQLADKYKGRRGDDEISWYAANAPLGGECEGDIACNLNRDRMMQGAYLKRHPYGRHAAETLKRLGESFESMQQTLEREPNYFREFSAAGGVIDELFDIVADANMKLTERAVAFKRIKAIRRTFKQSSQ